MGEADTMNELEISKKSEAVMFTIRVDQNLLEFYDELAGRTNRSRNEVIGIALEYAKDKIRIKTK